MKNTVLTALLGASLFLISCEKSALPVNAGNQNTPAGNRMATDPIQPAYSVPGVVLTSFNSLYPRAFRTVWQAADRITWQVKFFLGDEYWLAFFKSDGTFISASML